MVAVRTVTVIEVPVCVRCVRVPIARLHGYGSPPQTSRATVTTQVSRTEQNHLGASVQEEKGALWPLPFSVPWSRQRLLRLCMSTRIEGTRPAPACPFARERCGPETGVCLPRRQRPVDSVLGIVRCHTLPGCRLNAPTVAVGTNRLEDS